MVYFIMKFIKQKIVNLRKKLRYWEYLYYIKNTSIVSDEEYDITLKELHILELNYPNLITKYSPTQCIGDFKNRVNFDRNHHKTPMLSLNSINSESQLLLFDKRVKYKLNKDKNHIITYCCELKIDGIAVNLLYKQGNLIQASTRGDGKIGENIISNVRVISKIPKFLQKNKCSNKKLPFLLEIRGEVFISKSCFLKINDMMSSKGYKLFSNARNAASGLLRQLHPNIAALRILSFYCYSISYYIGKEKLPDSHWGRLQLCNTWGIPISSNIYVVQGLSESLEYYNHIKKIRSDILFNIDGIVIKIDSCKYQRLLGYNAKAPNWAVAYKFPAVSVLTKLNKIIFQVGRTGIITPVACVDSVVVDNIVIKKVNMHNINEIKRLNLMIGDTIRIQRAGDVIPKILEVISSKRSEGLKPVVFPSVCPICNSILQINNNNSSSIRCTGKLICMGQRKAALKHFVSRKAMNIKGIGEKVINQLVNKNLVCTPVDFFDLNKDKLMLLDRYGISSIERLLKSINLAKKTTLSRFIYALGIPNVGETVANNLAIEYKTIENLLITDFKSLLHLKCIGKIVAINIFHFLKNVNNLKIVQDLIHPSIGIEWIH